MSIEIQNNSQILYGYVKDLNIQEIVQRLYWLLFWFLQ
jgi:hypothetical protein